VFDTAREICREAAEHCLSPKAVRSAKTVAAVECLARGDKRQHATVEQWDPDKYLLNTPGGVVDLRTGAKREQGATDYMTKMTAAAAGGDCPRWRQFLDEVTAGGKPVQEFLQRMAGYCLTGDTNEHALFFVHGPGGNGKSVFINVLSAILADDHRSAPIETFTAAHVDRHPTELAMLRSARLVTATETEEGRRWAESKVKALTGGERIAARFMRQDSFEYVPQFKLLIGGNHKPALRSVDEAIRRRMHLIPFTVKIAPVKRDVQLSEKLAAEWPGILQWAIDGCVDWLKRRLAPPATVIEATATYLENEDAVGQWLQDECFFNPDARDTPTRL
jgi:putative DNA primase/helicase